MNLFRNTLVAAGLAVFSVSAVSAPIFIPRAAHASEVKVIVNNIPITTYDIQRRAAFLRLQRKPTAGAKQAMIDQTLHWIELQRLHINISDQVVNKEFAGFAKKNKMTTAQLTKELDRAGVTADHFKKYMRVEMGWGQALRARFRAEGGNSARAAVEAMLKKGGEKPKAIEYRLQQVIFVVPKRERGAILGKRKREAQALRARFTGCDQTYEITKGLIDVTVRDLGRVLAPELPTDWAEPIKNTKSGQATPVRETERGVEFIGICSEREVSDDRVAELAFQTDENRDQKTQDLAKKYTDELRGKAVIIER
ncbi:MAG: peptidylprolyl isomerase [Hyphomicrobiales bacterium]|nr:peptidylprolyl isomerase [Hyphomicrobiales bacterium]